jgi:hypothetical protein
MNPGHPTTTAGIIGARTPRKRTIRAAKGLLAIADDQIDHQQEQEQPEHRHHQRLLDA